MFAWLNARRLGACVIDWLIRYARRTPYEHVGSYMERYWIIRPRAWLPFAVRLHIIKRSDAGRDLHDHPWWFATLILRGYYYESTDERCLCGHRRGAGSFAFHGLGFRHRLIVPPWGGGAITLFIHGRKSRAWGFYTPGGFVPADKYGKRA